MYFWKFEKYLVLKKNTENIDFPPSPKNKN